MPKKQKGLKKAKKIKVKKAFGKPVDVTGVAGGMPSACACSGMTQDPASVR